MKANELMIGDWVTSRKWIEKPFKLITISERKGDFFYGRTSENSIIGPFFIESFEPIPITPEILEKNGFRKGMREYTLIHFEKNELPISLNPLDGGGFEWNDSDLVIITEMNFVHELQHVLRLCGIDKEIVL